MADSIGLQVSKAVEVALNLSSVTLPSGVKSPPAGLNVDRERLSSVTWEEVRNGPVIIISIAGEPRVNRDHWKSPKTDRTQELIIEIWADATDIPTADAVDPGYNWVVHALQSDPTLGGLAHFIHENASRSGHLTFHDSAKIVGGRELKIHIEFHSRTDDPEVRNN